MTEKEHVSAEDSLQGNNSSHGPTTTREHDGARCRGMRKGRANKDSTAQWFPIAWRSVGVGDVGGGVIGRGLEVCVV